MATYGVADAKRRFSELLDRVAAGERIVIERRGKPAGALVPPDHVEAGPTAAPLGFASIAGILADIDVDEMVAEIYADRRRARDRPAPEFD
jgi:prevent-host-death family protein